MQHRDYTQVPPLRKDDNVLPSASEIPSMLSAFRHARRRRISVGPQSEADAREYIANREQRRKNSRSASSSRRKQSRKAPNVNESNGDVASPVSEESPKQPRVSADSAVHKASLKSLQISTTNRTLLTPPASDAGASSDSSKEDERNDRAMFSAVEKPRTHYDVEVITKLVVYAGEFSSLSTSEKDSNLGSQALHGLRWKETQSYLSASV